MESFCLPWICDTMMNSLPLEKAFVVVRYLAFNWALKVTHWYIWGVKENYTYLYKIKNYRAKFTKISSYLKKCKYLYLFFFFFSLFCWSLLMQYMFSVLCAISLKYFYDNTGCYIYNGRVTKAYLSCTNTWIIRLFCFIYPELYD